MHRLAIALILLLPAAGLAEEFTGKVVRISDGDTIRVLRDGQELKVRLEGIDSPESGQPFGNKAKSAASDLAFRKTVTVQVTGKDRYGRTLGVVILPDGTYLNRELVRRGFAWWFHKYSRDETLGALEAEARKEKRGLWADPNPIPPWTWRKTQGSNAEEPAEVQPNGIEIVALLPNPEGRDEGHEQITIGNSTERDVKLDGWKARDQAGNEFALSGTVLARKRLVITMTEPSMPLNNDGDEVVLVDAGGVVCSRVAYKGDEVRVGKAVVFGK